MSKIKRLPVSIVPERNCRFPLWPDHARADHRYCGEKRFEGSYCEEHWKRTHQKGDQA